LGRRRHLREKLMIVDQTIIVAASAADTFRRVVDIPFVGGCLPGADDITDVGDGVYQGRFAVRVGPVRVTLHGNVRIIESDSETGTALLRLSGADSRIGGNVAGDMRLEVRERTATESELIVHIDMAVSGKLGQFGQAVMLKKADQITEGFVEQFAERMQSGLLVDEVVTNRPTVSSAIRAAGHEGGPSQTPVRPGSASVRADRGNELTVQTVAALHGVNALLRQDQGFVMVQTLEAAKKAFRAGQKGTWWVPDASPSTVVALAPARAEFVLEVRAGDPTEFRQRWNSLSSAGQRLPVAVALVPQGSTVGDWVATRDLCRAVADIAQRPVLLVARSPWSALPAARLVATGSVHGLALMPHHTDTGLDRCTCALVEQAVAEVRNAGLLIPIIVGPTVRRNDDSALRAAGANAVITLRRTPPLRRIREGARRRQRA